MTDRRPDPPLPWTPDQKLRADATDEQLYQRSSYTYDLCRAYEGGDSEHALRDATALLCREFAAACVEDARRASPAAPATGGAAPSREQVEALPTVATMSVGEMLRPEELIHRAAVLRFYDPPTGTER